MAKQEPWSDIERSKALVMYFDGRSYREIGNSLNRTRSSVAGLIKRETVLCRNGERRKPRPRVKRTETHREIPQTEQIELTRHTYDGLKRAADCRGVKPSFLADTVLAVIIEDHLWKAVLDAKLSEFA